MSIAFLRWQMIFDGPLHSGYGLNLAEYTGRRERGARSSIQLETHPDPQSLEPAFLISSIKGVFRSVVAWQVERLARQAGATRFVTADYSEALDRRWRRALQREDVSRLCPVSRIFGGSGSDERQTSAGALRLKSPVTFGFDGGKDAYHASVRFGPEYWFTWQTLLQNRGQALRVEQLAGSDDLYLVARMDPAVEAGIVLLWLAGDLISSGVFRFGRFTSRGYGIVRLVPHGFALTSLDALLSGEPVTELAVSQTGYETARAYWNDDPGADLFAMLAQYARPTLERTEDES